MWQGSQGKDKPSTEAEARVRRTAREPEVSPRHRGTQVCQETLSAVTMIVRLTAILICMMVALVVIRMGGGGGNAGDGGGCDHDGIDGCGGCDND